MATRITPHRKTLGENLRHHRKRAKLSQEKLAEKSDLSTVFISQVERGVKTISIDSLARIAKALETRVSILTRGF